jgi:hypothetical protein
LTGFYGSFDGAPELLSARRPLTSGAPLRQLWIGGHPPPAAQEHLAQIGRQIGAATLRVVFGELPVVIAGAKATTPFSRHSGRLGIDEKMMREAIAVRDAIHPHEPLLVGYLDSTYACHGERRSCG